MYKGIEMTAYYHVLVGVAIFAYGLFTLSCPRALWFITRGWQYDNPKEVRLSRTYLLANAVGAIMAILIALMLIFGGFQGGSEQ
jgi:hypothetical protein